MRKSSSEPGLSIQARLVLLVLVSIAPVVAFGALMGYRYIEAQRAELQLEARERAQSLAAGVDRELDGMVATLELLALSPALQKGDLATFHALITDALKLRRFATGIVLLDTTGQVLVTTLKPFGEPLPRRTDLETLNRVIATGRPQVSDLITSAVMQRPIVSIEVPVVRDGQVVQVLAAGLTPDGLSQVLADQHLPAEWYAAIFDRNGITAARTRDLDRFLGKPMSPGIQRRLARSERDAWFFPNFTNEGTPVYTTLARSASSGWAVAIGVPRYEVDAPLRRSERLAAGGGVFLTLGGVLVALVAGRRIARPVRSLIPPALALGRGEIPGSPIGGVHEVHEVGEAMKIAAAMMQSRTLERDRAVDELQRLNETLEKRVAARTRELEETVEQLRRSEERYSALFEQSPTIMYLVELRPDGRLLFEDVNPAAYKLTGFRRSEMVGRSPEEVFGPEYGSFMAGQYRACAEKRQLLEYEIAGELPVGRAARRTILVPLLGPDGQVVRIFGTSIDITETVRLEEHLRQAQKMEAVGQLTGGVAHDFNNLLTAVLGNLELAQSWAVDERMRKLLDAALRAGRRGAKLTEQLLAFARKQRLRTRAVDINRLIASMKEMLERTLGPLVRIEVDLQPALWPVHTDPTQLELVILNLAINARDAMPSGGRLSLEAANVPAGSSDLPKDLAPSDYVVLTVCDSGTGMSPEVLSRAFEPFYTTKEVGKGSGLGLSQVYGFVRQSGGTVTIDSRLGQGTSVRVYLRRADAAAPSAPEEKTTDMGKEGGGATILVVDDDDDVRELAVHMLGELGYQVHEAPNGRAALSVLAQDQGIDLLLVDYAMPGMTGIELIAEARLTRKDLPAILVTGYADAMSLDVAALPVLRKPFTRAKMAAEVRSALSMTGRTAAAAMPLYGQPRQY
jgi:PAS domain S-box-containing protein